MDMKKFLNDDVIFFKGYAGSISYGTNLPTSDVDIRGLFCADPINIRTPFFPIKEIEHGKEEDTKYYELAHFLKLCLDCNPNIIEMLWLDESDILKTSPAYELLRKNREQLLSSKIAFTTSGYALAQLKRIKNHNKWINCPQPVETPQPIDFLSLIQNFGDTKIMPNDFAPRKLRKDARLIHYGNEIYGLYMYCRNKHLNTKHSTLYADNGKLNTTFDGERHLLPTPSAILKFNKEEYKIAKEKHSNYWNWKKNRNKARAGLEEKHKFDTKHAMHLVRLLRMGHEALTTGQIIVKRPDAVELLSIRNGDWTYEEIIEYAEHMDNEIKTTLYKNTSLPKYPDIKYAATLLMDVQDIFWENCSMINTKNQMEKV